MDCSSKEEFGDVRFAVEQLIRDLVEGKLSNTQILARWDYARGKDWITATKRDKAKGNALRRDDAV